MFGANGYAATTIQAVADEASVAVQTVYATFGNKRRLLDELIEAAITGDSSPDTDLTQSAEAAAIAGEPDLRRRAQVGRGDESPDCRASGTDLSRGARSGRFRR